MLPQDLKVGCVYYRITYADPQLTVPAVEPIVFIGTGAFDFRARSREPVYTFQDTVSFSRSGSAVDDRSPANLSEQGARTYSFTVAQLNTLVNLVGAAEALNDAVERSHWKDR